MIDYEALTQKVLDVCIGLGPTQRVWINTWDYDRQLACELAWQCVKRGCPTLNTVQFEELWVRSIVKAPIEVIDNLPAHQASALKETDVYIFTLGPRTIPWNEIPFDRRNLVTRWFSERNKFVEQWKAIAKARRLKMLGIEATLATPERASALGLNYEEWRQMMFKACMVNHEEMGEHAKALARLLGSDDNVHITTHRGTNLTFKLDNRPVDWSDGILRSEWIDSSRPVFLPAGGIEVSADETSAEGSVFFDSPILSLVQEGRIDDLRLNVSRGRIDEFSSTSRKREFESWLQQGNDDTRKFGFFGLGLNPELRHGFTQDDKVLGGVTIGFGDNSDKGGRNRADKGFWASMKGATVTIGDNLVMKDGHLFV